MKRSVGRGAKYFAPTFIIALIVVVALLSMRQPAVNAGSPPPDVPDFEGEPVTFVIEEFAQISQETIEPAAPKAGWVSLLSEDFENGIPFPPWTNLSPNGSYIWGTESILNPLDPTSTMVAWGVGTGQPELDPQIDGYPANVHSLLRAGPFDFTDVIAAQLTFESFFDADIGDKFQVGVSTDGSTFVGDELNGGTGSWTTSSKNISDMAGQPQVYFVFGFLSDDTGSTKLGALIDNVDLSVQYTSKNHMPYISDAYTPTPVPPTVTPTSTWVPEQDYRDDFTDTIIPWAASRWTLGTTYNLQHRADCDQGGRCGFLELEVQNKESYVIVSPLVQSKSYPYNIEIKARLMPKTDSDYPPDQAQYGIIFGGNWNGEPCPTADFSSCFTQYYELRVRFRDTGDKHYLEFKLKKVEGHDADNQNFGPDIINWKKVGADPKNFVEWDVNVNSDGKISISENNNFVASVKDTTYLNNKYFGVEVRNGTKEKARVKFDYFKID